MKTLDTISVDRSRLLRQPALAGGRELRSGAELDDAEIKIAMDTKTTQAINTRVSPQTLREITDPSGGRTEIVQTTDELHASTARIAEELSNQYLLGYVSPKGADGQFHSIRVRIRGTDYRVRARNGYVARTGG